ncbi:MAG: ABC transporter ATP-binding protein [Desulfatitalea sp.]|nr:ATP-binding cassette domain-containing protein [Desulfatitalea sp.]NNK00053.1 ABC transporter ATP-binding protein [Desulfatitalea sp.]
MSHTAANIVLKVDRLHKTFAGQGKPSVQALKGVSLAAAAGCVTGLIGADGAGKSTLIRIAAGLLRPTQGAVRVLGLDSTAAPLEIQRWVGYMPQRFGLYEDLNVRENMDLHADLQGVPDSERAVRYQRLLAMTGLGPFTRRMAGNLSGGMKQKLGLACALIKSPRMLLLDEPTVGVDPVSRRELWKIVYQLVDETGIAVLLSTAYLDEAERCHQVAVLHEGEKIAEGPPARFSKQMRGRVFIAEPPAVAKPRQVQARLAGSDGILDATIRSGRVRLVTDGRTTIADRLFKPWAIALQAADPCFEDAFMALIPQTQPHPVVPELPTPPAVSVDSGVVVQVASLSKRFGAFEAVKGLSFEVRRGEIFGLLGPNGAGKSTTFRMLCGLLSASGGDIAVAGRNLRRASSRARARLGYMAQKFSLYTQLSVAENLLFFGRAYGLSGRRLSRRMAWAYTEFDLGRRQEQPAGALPGGYKQRLAMAAALLHEPDILFLDEPTSGVDPLARREFWLRINGFAEQGVTVVVTTHFMEEAEYCDRLLIMSQGEQLALGTPADIRQLARKKGEQEPTIEDAFITLAQDSVDTAA